MKIKYFHLTFNLTTQPCQIQKTSKLTTHKHMLSKLATHQTMKSKLLCHVQNHAFGLVSTSRYFYDFNTSNFHAKTP